MIRYILNDARKAAGAAAAAFLSTLAISLGDGSLSKAELIQSVTVALAAAAAAYKLTNSVDSEDE